MDDERAATADLGEAVKRTPRRSNRMQFHALPNAAEGTAPHPRTITGTVRPALPLASAVRDRKASLEASVSLGTWGVVEEEWKDWYAFAQRAQTL
jgi:hypothetical protein